jgi:rhodanese-related sulfurtransferase
MRHVGRVAVAVACVMALVGVGTGLAAGPTSSGLGTAVTAPGGTYRQIGPTTLKAMLDQKDFTFVNVHVPYEGEIAQTDAHVPYDQIAGQLTRLPAARNAKIVLYCRSGRMSRIAAETLVRLGYTNVWDLTGGFEAWKGAGFPLASK